MLTGPLPLNYLYPLFLRTAFQTLFYWPTFEVVHRWYMEQAFLENSSSQVVGVMGCCSVAYLCVCTRSSLSPLKLCASFVFAEEGINHQHRKSTVIKNSKWMKKEEGWGKWRGRSFAERFCSVAKSRDSFSKWEPIHNPQFHPHMYVSAETGFMLNLQHVQLTSLAGS